MGGGSSWPWTALAVPSSFLFNVFHMWLWTPVSDFFSKYRVTILLKQLMQSILTCFQDLSFYFCNYWASLSVLLSHFSSNFILLFVLQCFGVSNCLVWLWSKSMLTKIAFLQQWRNSHWGLSCAPQHRAVLHTFCLQNKGSNGGGSKDEASCSSVQFWANSCCVFTALPGCQHLMHCCFWTWLNGIPCKWMSWLYPWLMMLDFDSEVKMTKCKLAKQPADWMSLLFLLVRRHVLILSV